MPIKGHSDIRRIPRVGKIHLGMKQTSERSGNTYPVACDHFVVKPDESTSEAAADAFYSIYGETPKEIAIAETHRKRKVEDFIRRLSLRESILRNQLRQREFSTNEQFLQGLLSAVDAIIQDIVEEFDLKAIEPSEHTEQEWVLAAAMSPSFEFLNDPSEDIYTVKDGRRIDDSK